MKAILKDGKIIDDKTEKINPCKCQYQSLHFGDVLVKECEYHRKLNKDVDFEEIADYGIDTPVSEQFLDSEKRFFNPK